MPADALLIVVGDFSTDAMLEQVEKDFRRLESAAARSRRNSPAPPRYSGRHVHLVHLPGTVQTQVLLGNLAITRRDPDWYRLVLANSIYGGAFHSRLVMNIREQKGYTYSPRSGINALRQYGYFTVHAAVRNEVVAATLTEMFYEMDRMRSLPVTAEELESARSYLTGVFSLGVATQDGLLGQLSTVYLERLPEDYLETYRERIRALTAEDVLAAARRHFDSANAQIVIVGDRDQIAEQAALFGEVTEYTAQGQRSVAHAVRASELSDAGRNGSHERAIRLGGGAPSRSSRSWLIRNEKFVRAFCMIAGYVSGAYVSDLPTSRGRRWRRERYPPGGVR